jgi:PilZ domain
MYPVTEPFPEDIAITGLPKLTMPFTSERRRWPRTPVHWRVQFFTINSEPLECITRDVSTGGFYAASEWPFKPGECLSCILSIPAHRSGRSGETLRVQCRVEVVRVESGVESGFGTAYRILDYRVCGVQRP